MTLRKMAVGLSVLYCCSAAMALRYNWEGAGADPNWTTCENWDRLLVLPCSPSSANDDVVFGATSGEGEHEVTLDFAPVTIDDMEIVHGVKFTGTGSSSTITMDTLTIDANDIALDIYADKAILIAN